ncbi:MAG: glycosyltransferase family 2 protein [Bryobacterales bacterium]|nr:glycosyltransferase family 2 protein [Bryobacterales bacterium]
MNNRKYLEDCLDSLYGVDIHFTFDVVLVDNGSTDGTLEMVRARFPQVLMIENGANVGLSRATNQGIKATSGRYVLLLNDDTLVNGPSLDALVGALESDPKVGAAGGKLLNGDGSLQSGYSRFSTLREEFLIATALGGVLWEAYPYGNDAEEPLDVDWLGSACLLLRRSALDQTGLLDEEYFIYGDEADLQYRLRKSGWRVSYVPACTTIHFGGRSLDRWRRRKMVYRGKMLFYRKNYGAGKTAVLRFMFAVLSLAKMVVWGTAFLVPAWRTRAKRELASNADVIKVCWKLA